ncbi:MAG TPA: bifunctional diguanylate cyclase/phosphodiesterase [Longimicrobiales bacterium]|nr:bifunctional diguanylate cyclase/phosphodiesterase [Longimicrobiales bacterium]
MAAAGAVDASTVAGEPFIVVRLTADGEVIALGPRGPEALRDYAPGLLGRSVADVVHPDDRAAFWRALDAALAAPLSSGRLVARLRLGREYRTVELTLVRVDAPEGPLAMTLREATAAPAVKAGAGINYQTLFENSRDAIYVSTPEGRFLEINQAAVELFGYAREELLELNAVVLYTAAEDRDRFIEEVGSKGFVRDFELRLRRKDGVELICLLTSVVQYGEAGQAVAFQGIIHDITDRKRAEESLRHAALHDGLTQLPNRVHFLDRLRRTMDRLRWRPEYRFAVLFIDLDRFKVVNDSLGHRAGDELLIAISERLTASVRPEDIVARLGGDEFAVLLGDLGGVSDAMAIADRVRDSMRAPFEIHGREIYATMSIGIALSTNGYASAEELLRDADTAMYAAKGRGTEQCVIFNEEMHARAVALLEMEMALRRALEREEFRLFYQPIVALDTQSIIGFEALLRWEHPELGLLAPDEFLQVAEETGLMVPIGWWSLREACRAAREWRQGAETDPALVVSVNLSGRQLLIPDLAAQIRRTLEETGLDGRALRLEISESDMVERAGSVQRTLRELRALGVRLCIDDFGTGYSSLSYLQDYDIDVLKIDGRFTSLLGGPAEDAEMVKAILLMAHSLGLSAIAEGVETTAQVNDLVQLGCGLAQGHLFSRPVRAREVLELLKGSK